MALTLIAMAAYFSYLGLLEFRGMQVTLVRPIILHRSPKPPRVAIIIDDVGDNAAGIREMFELGIPLTVAILPYTETTASLAEDAHRRKFDVLLHLPMEPKFGSTTWLGPNAIVTSLSDEETRKRVEAALGGIPHVVGINNHMGSRVSEDLRIITAVLQVAMKRGMFFVDSRTTPRTVIPQVASQIGVPCYNRDVFLDGTRNPYLIRKSLELLAEKALKRGWAIAIGHVGPEGGELTADVIRSMLPLFRELGIRFVCVTGLFR